MSKKPDPGRSDFPVHGTTDGPFINYVVVWKSGTGRNTGKKFEDRSNAVKFRNQKIADSTFVTTYSYHFGIDEDSVVHIDMEALDLINQLIAVTRAYRYPRTEQIATKLQDHLGELGLS